MRLVTSSPNAKAVDLRRQALPLLEINGAVLCDYDGLDPAGRWCDCPRPLCPHAAYLVELFPTVAAARHAARARAERFAEDNLPSRRDELLRSHRLYIRWLYSDKARGRDYRSTGCSISKAADQLRAGRGDEPAWEEIKRQRREDGTDGALLYSENTTGGLLFVYVNAMDLLDVGEIFEEVSYPF